ncbi:MAG TPA: hypothetical protein ENH94_11670 [Phycisphaerales bacterium]|nr:hypothetical protein [Phycisphaerales bacterium]
MVKTAFGPLFLGFCMVIVGCSDSSSTSKQSEEPQPGEYYWFKSADGDYKVLKVLAVDSDATHICYYTNVFKDEPGEDVIPSLYFGRLTSTRQETNPALLDIVNGKRWHGRKHMPLTQDNWYHWEPQLFHSGSVDPTELESYEKWKNGNQEVLTYKFIPGN